MTDHDYTRRLKCFHGRQAGAESVIWTTVWQSYSVFVAVSVGAVKSDRP